MHELKACGVLVVDCEPANPLRIRRFLLMQHPTRWDLPKGHVDPGETEEFTTALRELSEETGIPADAVEIDPDFRFEHHYQVRSTRTGGEEWPKTLVIFLGRLLRPVEIQLTEHTGYQWFPWQPPHQIQSQTIDPLLAAVAQHLSS
ncbi:MAG: bis(5'-nucleosyl)-tetraphosphatase, partial [Planctomycetaceae bacterium]